MATAEHSSVPERARVLIRELLASERRTLGTILAHGVGIGIVSIAAPLSADALVSAIAFGGLIQPVVVLSLLLLSALAFGALLRASSYWVVELMEQRLFARVTLEANEQLRRPDNLALSSSMRDPANRLLDLSKLHKGFAHLLSEALFLAIQVVVSAALLSLYHPYLLAFGIAVLFAAVVTLSVPRRRGERTSIKESTRRHELVSVFERLAGAADPVSRALPDRHAVEEHLGAYLDARRAHARVVLGQVSAFAIIQAVGLAALLGLGGVLVLHGQLTVGQLVGAELLMSLLLAGLAKAGKHVERYYDLVAAADKVSSLLERAPSMTASSQEVAS